KRVMEKTEAVDSMINYAYQFYSHDELNKLAAYYENPTIIHIIGGRENIVVQQSDKTFMWGYLKKLSNNSEELKEMLNLSIVKLRAVTGIVYMLPKLAEISLLALIFMFTQWINYVTFLYASTHIIPIFFFFLIGCQFVPTLKKKYDEFIDKANTVLEKFYLWPMPYGTSARDLLVRLKKERIAPGLSMLQRIWRESHMPEIVTEEMGSFRPLYYLLDSRDSKALVMANLMFIEPTINWGDGYKIQASLSPRLCAILLLNVVHHSTGISQTLVKCIRKLKDNEAMTFYKQVMDAFLESTKCNTPAEAKESRRKAFAILANELIARVKDRTEEIDPQNISLKKKKNKKKKNEKLQDIPEDFRPQLPVYNHTGLICDLVQEEWPKKGQIACGDAVYPFNEVLVKMRNILLQYSELSLEKDPITLRFAIAGSDRILNSVCWAYAALSRHYSALISQFNLEFFVIPFSKNHYTEWLARMDPWYKLSFNPKRVFVCFTSKRNDNNDNICV
ncbi:hypothetical protein RFI_27324, partial [Reticulomyxa filosa]